MNWLDMNLDEMIEACLTLDLPKFRAKQVFEWLHKGVGFEDMRNLPKALRSELAQARPLGGVKILEKRLSAIDDTVKYLFLLEDGNVIEGVLMRYEHGKTLCISSQVGCSMGCVFCASTIGGLVRNLAAGEMLGQVIAVEKEQRDVFARRGEEPKEGREISNIVMMGSGEPLDNYDNTIRFLRLANAKEGFNASLRNISVSTCGLPDKIVALAKDASGVNLSVSLHAPNDALRQSIMPIARKHSLQELMRAVREFVRLTSRRVIFEYVLVEGVNDAQEQIGQLTALLRNLQCHVNVIPLNSVKERSLQGASRKAAWQFAQQLENGGLSATVRREMGSDIEGACGQLRRGYLERQ